jgi:hypothetical protein
MPAPDSNRVARPSWGGLARHWSVVLTAGHDSAPGVDLCGAYWYPLYCFVRRQGSVRRCGGLTQVSGTPARTKGDQGISREKAGSIIPAGGAEVFLADEQDKEGAEAGRWM